MTSVELALLLERLRPAEMVLRDYVRPMLNTEVLQRIAEMDYCEEVEENLQAIKELLAVKRLPEELWWPPRAVIELASYGEPDDPRWPEDLLSGRTGHAARLFACLVLVRSDDLVTPAATLGSLIESALALGPDATEDAVRYLAWCRLHEPGVWGDRGDERAFLTLGLLLTYLMSPLRQDPEIVAALNRVCVAEVRAALAEDDPWWPEQPPRALLRERAGGGGFRRWRALVGRCDSKDFVPMREWFQASKQS